MPIDLNPIGPNPNFPGSDQLQPNASNPNPVVSNADNMVTTPEDWMNLPSVKVKLTRLIDDFKPQESNAVFNRETRYKDLEIQKLRHSGQLKEDEFMIPMRAIDQNIRREHPLYMNYLKNSRRIMIFDAIKDSNYNSEEIEYEFTRIMTYSGWEIPHFKVVDGASTHGWDSVEVVMDTTKPGHVAIEHISNDMFIFPASSQNIQFNEVVMRKFVVYPKQLRNIAIKFEFDLTQLEHILQDTTKEQVEKTINIYKCFYRQEGIVYVAWFQPKCDAWLKEPQQLFLGKKQKVLVESPPTIDPMSGMPIQIPAKEELRDAPETIYPIFLLPYYMTERPRVMDNVGRVFLDKHKQEAKTANISQFLNGCQRASGFYPYLDAPSSKSAKELQAIKLKSGSIPPIPFKIMQLAYPDQTMLQLQNYLDTVDSNEAGQVSFAVNNRQDSRKTATEVSAAMQENNNLNSVQVMLFSTFLREVYTFVWGIIKSKAINGEITFMHNEGVGGNDIAKIDLDFDLRAAGDIDVIKRAEQLQQYKEFWQIVAQTPIALRYLSDMLRLAFPLDGKGEMYANELLLGDPTMLIQQLLEIINVTIDEEDLASLAPEARMNMQNIIMQAKGLIQRQSLPLAPQGGESTQGGNSPQGSPLGNQQESPAPTAATSNVGLPLQG